jgi:CBS domain-containing protein
MTLREVLHAHIPILTAESTVRDAVDKMDIYQFPALVVVNESAKPIAVVTEGDLCRSVTVRDNLSGMAQEPAIVHGTADPTTAHPDMDIGDAFHRMLSSGLTVLPVVEDDRLSGVVLRVDLMQALLLDSTPAS